MGDLLNMLKANGLDLVGFYNSSFFSVFEFIIGIYVVVLFADIVLMLTQRGLSGNIKDAFLGMNIPAELVARKGKLRKKWDKVREKMEEKNESAYKVAIISADSIIDDLIKRMQYPGENMGERLAKITPGQIENIEELKKAHEIRNHIIHEEDFSLSEEKAKEVIGYYENFLRYFQVLN